MEASNNNVALLTPYKMGNFNLSHRVVLPPLTRNRAYKNMPQPHAIEYYSQRTTQDMPGIWKKEQVEAWKPIVNAVHEKGGIFFCQFWHKGFKPDYNQEKFIFAGGIEVSSTPHHLTTKDMSGIVHDLRVAALNAIEAGFNGVEIHSAYGYLLENEVYGGTLENHCRLALEVVEAVANEIGAEKVGVKLSPFYDSNGTRVSSPESVGVYMVNELNKLGILYVHMVEKRFVKSTDNSEFNRSLGSMRKTFRGTFMVNMMVTMLEKIEF